MLRQWLLISFMIFPCFALAKVEKVSDLKQLKIYGFLKKENGLAVVTAGQKKYTVAWVKFAKANPNIAADHETRQAKYTLPFDKDLKVETETTDKDKR